MLPEQVEYRSCRRCRVKLKEPVSNQRSAFCCKGCHRNWYAQRGMACEGPKSERHGRECRIELAAIRRHGRMGKFHQKRAGRPDVPESDEARSQTPIFIGSAGQSKPTDRWHIVAGPELSERSLHFATLNPPPPPKMASDNTASIGKSDYPVNIIGGHKWPGARDIKV